MGKTWICVPTFHNCQILKVLMSDGDSIFFNNTYWKKPSLSDLLGTPNLGELPVYFYIP